MHFLVFLTNVAQSSSASGPALSSRVHCVQVSPREINDVRVARIEELKTPHALLEVVLLYPPFFCV